jgi:peptide/nickel transport system substrate-binding protein
MRMRFSLWGAGLAAAVALAVPAAAQQTPKYGGILTYMIPADAPPSFDGHRETTYATIHTAAPFYSTLIRINPYDPGSTTDIVCDLCTEMPKSTDGGKTYTFKIRHDVTFHNGDKLTAYDVAASLNEIVFPPKGVLSPRANIYAMVKNIEATDPYTVVIHLKFATPAFLPALANPYNFIYQKKVLDKNPHWYEHHILGSGPFQFVSYQVGQSIKGKRYDKYYHKELPYLDGFVGIYAPKQAVQLDAIRADRAAIEFRGYPPSAINQLKAELDGKIKVQTSDWNCTLGAWINTKKKPFDDVRVRRALTLAIDRWGSQKGLSQISLYKTGRQPCLPDLAARSVEGAARTDRRVLARHRQVAGRGAQAPQRGRRLGAQLRAEQPQRRSALQIPRRVAGRSMDEGRAARHPTRDADRAMVRGAAQRQFPGLDRR